MREPVWLTRAIIEAAQADQIREHGGQVGLRDAGLLESALARPQHVWSYEADADLAALGAEYGFGLAKNHAFLDGNKRIAFVATNIFLILNGYEIEAGEPEVVDTMVRVADGRLSRNRFAAWIRNAMVKISDWERLNPHAGLLQDRARGALRANQHCGNNGPSVSRSPAQEHYVLLNRDMVEVDGIVTRRGEWELDSVVRCHSCRRLRAANASLVKLRACHGAILSVTTMTSTEPTHLQLPARQQQQIVSRPPIVATAPRYGCGSEYMGRLLRLLPASVREDY